MQTFKKIRILQTQGRRVLALSAALLALGTTAAGANELTFQLAPRDFSSDSMGGWMLSYDRLVDEQFAVGLALGVADIEGRNDSKQGLAAAIRATHYMRPLQVLPLLQPTVGLEIAGATRSDRRSTTLGGFVGARFPLSPALDLRTDVLLARRKTTEESLFGSNGTTVANRTVTGLRLGVSFRY